MTRLPLITLILLATACGASPQQAPLATPGSKASEPAPLADLPQSKETGRITVSRELREICGIEDDHAYFDFNSSKVASKDNPFLEQLVTCFSTGPMAGKTLRLVGHADPRGEDSYNLALGERRAQSVRKALVQSGLPSERVSATSRGELDASGTDENEWARDRRVDIVAG